MEHRNLIAALCMISAFILPINAELKYVDASRLTLIGKVMPTPENVYHRVDTVKYNDMPYRESDADSRKCLSPGRYGKV